MTPQQADGVSIKEVFFEKPTVSQTLPCKETSRQASRNKKI